MGDTDQSSKDFRLSRRVRIDEAITAGEKLKMLQHKDNEVII